MLFVPCAYRLVLYPLSVLVFYQFYLVGHLVKLLIIGTEKKVLETGGPNPVIANFTRELNQHWRHWTNQDGSVTYVAVLNG